MAVQPLLVFEASHVSSRWRRRGWTPRKHPIFAMGLDGTPPAEIAATLGARAPAGV